MINLDTQYIKVDHPLQDNNNYQIHNHEFIPNGPARFNMSQSTLSKLFGDNITEYTTALFKPLFDRLVKTEEADIISFFDNTVNMPISYNQETDFSGMVKYVDETINTAPCKRILRV
jgi:hypothetical protein